MAKRRKVEHLSEKDFRLLLLDKLESIRKAVFLVASKDLARKGNAKVYEQMRKQGHSFEDIAALYGVTRSAVESAISQAKSKRKQK